jgi:hypothetical protein
MRRLIIGLLRFVVIEMVELLVMEGLLSWGPSQYFKSCFIYTLLVAVYGLSPVFFLFLCEVCLRCSGKEFRSGRFCAGFGI